MNEHMRIDEKLDMLEPYCILKGYRGSIAHNTYDSNLPYEDKDIMGIFVLPREFLYGIRHIETVERSWDEKLSQVRSIPWDLVYYSLQKYLRLMLKQNPNVIMLLWLAEKHYIKRTKWGNMLIENRDKLLSKQCYKSFSGYAHGQLHRMAHHGPTGRMGAKRKALVKEFGYDVKNAGHLIRILKMGMETLSTGEMEVERHDNNMLLDIKRGKWSLQKVLDYANELFKLVDQAFVASSLPEKVSEPFVNDLCEKITIGFWEAVKEKDILNIL